MASPIVKDVRAQFDAIPKKVRSSSLFGSRKKYLGARNTQIPWPDYTSDIANRFGHLEHFQGVQRIGRRLILSGGISTGLRRSQLIVVDMGTQADKGPWALPRYGHPYDSPPPPDTTIFVIDIDRRRWHAGGMQAVEDVIAVPIYGDTYRSEIRFIHFAAANEEPKQIPPLSKSHTQSKAVGLTRLSEPHYDGRYLLAVWDDLQLHFHYSKTKQLEDGFGEPAARLYRYELEAGFQAGLEPGAGTYQSVNLVLDSDGTVYLIASRNSQQVSPTFTGKDCLDLYRVSWPGGDLDSNPRVSFVASKQMYCYNQQCNFGAAVGIYVDDQHHLFLYAASHWLHAGNSRINFNEYSYR